MVTEALVRVIVWPVGPKKLKVSTRVTVLLTAESFVSEMVPMTLVPVGAMAGAPDAPTPMSPKTATLTVATAVGGGCVDGRGLCRAALRHPPHHPRPPPRQPPPPPPR